jgi:peptidoglycan lytic transglycosylase
VIVIRRATAYVVATVLLGGVALAGPSIVSAATGGAGLKGTVSGQPATGNQEGVVYPGNQVVSASGNGFSISTHASAFLWKGMRFTGHVPGSGVVEIQRSGRETNFTWQNTAHATAGSDGSFTINWPANHIGRFQFRAVVGGASQSPAISATVFRMAIATIYGPGEYGSTTACGEILKPTTIGTANRTLPCGTPVDVYWHGHTMVVPVIDRGPYANHADWDLTEATSSKLGMNGTETIGAVSLPH